MAWVGGIAEWIEGDTAYLSVAFTWHMRDAYERAQFYKAAGYRVRAGGPATFLLKKYLADVAEVGGDLPDAIARHNSDATFASRGCPVGCWFCIVPKLEGKEFTLLPEFPVRPMLCDSNLSALPADYQDYIVRRYEESDVPLMDASSGFEPRTFTPAVYERWARINRGPWRLAYDEIDERKYVKPAMALLRDSKKKKRIYVLIGNEPFAECMQRIQEVIDWGGEPHVQPFIKLNSLDRKPHARFDWTVKKLRDVARWANRYIWRSNKFSEYSTSIRNKKTKEEYDPQQGLFL